MFAFKGIVPFSKEKSRHTIEKQNKICFLFKSLAQGFFLDLFCPSCSDSLAPPGSLLGASEFLSVVQCYLSLVLHSKFEFCLALQVCAIKT